jgi:hypothetical protein
MSESLTLDHKEQLGNVLSKHKAQLETLIQQEHKQEF